MVGRTTMGYLVSSSATDGNVTTGLRNASAAQYFDPRSTISAHNSQAKDASCLGDLWPLSGTEGPFAKGAGLKNPRGPITMKHLEHYPGSKPNDAPQWTPPCGDASGRAVHPVVMVFYNNYVKTYTNRDPYFLTVGWEVMDGEGADSTTCSKTNRSQCRLIVRGYQR